MTKRASLAIALAAPVVASAGGAYAAANAGSPSITACVHRPGGGLYTGRPCARRDRSLIWNVVGPQGPPGVAGAPGAPGPPGVAGAPGVAGPSGVLDATTLMNDVPGPIPLEATFVKQRADTILVATFSGSGYWNLSPGTGLLVLDIDDNDVGVSRMYFNNSGEHLAYPAQQVVVRGIGAGRHTISLIGLGLFDSNDYFTVTVQELVPAG